LKQITFNLTVTDFETVFAWSGSGYFFSTQIYFAIIEGFNLVRPLHILSDAFVHDFTFRVTDQDKNTAIQGPD
jgi:hypothetical protein